MSDKTVDLTKMLENLEQTYKKTGEATALLEVMNLINNRKKDLKHRFLYAEEKEIISRELLEIRKAILNIARVKHIELN